MALDERDYMIERARKRLNDEYARMDSRRNLPASNNRQRRERGTHPLLIVMAWITIALVLWIAFKWAGR